MFSKRFLAFFAVVMVQVFYGLNYTFANDVIDGGYVGPYGFILIRVLGATALFWMASLFTPPQKIEKKDWSKIMVAGVFGVQINMLAFFKGLAFTTPIHASVIMTATPVIVLVLSIFFLSEKLLKNKILGIAMALIGAVVLSVYGGGTHQGDNIPLGNFFVFINALSYSIYLIVVKKLMAQYHVIVFCKWLFLIGIFFVLPFAWSEFSVVHWSALPRYVVMSIAFVVVFATFATYLLNPWALKYLKASTVSSFLYLQSVIAGIFAFLMGSDHIDFFKVGAMLLIFAGVYLVSRPPKVLVMNKNKK